MINKKIANMSKQDIIELIEDLVFDYDNSVQDIRAFERKDLHNVKSDLLWTLHNGKRININITIEDE